MTKPTDDMNKSMDIKQYVEAKRKLESDLAAMIQAGLRKFEVETGQCVHGVTINVAVSQHRCAMVAAVRVNAPVE